MNRSRLNVGIAGYGVVGKRRRLHIDANPRLKTVAVCDVKFDSNGRFPDGVSYYPHYSQLLEEDLDVLFVSLPNYLAAEVTIAGLGHGLHVFCEKPPGRDVSDVERVIRAQEDQPNSVLKYGFNHRYHDSVREALSLIENRTLGEIINLHGVYGKSKIIPFEGGWRSERRFAGGGILLDQGIHMVDLMRLFCGDFDEVKSFVSNKFWKHDVEDNAYALMSDRQGRIAMLHSSATYWQHRFSLVISMTEGFIELSGLLTNSKSYGEERLIVGRRDESDHGTLRQETIKYLKDNSWRDEIDEFSTSILDKKPLRHGTSAEALATMRLVYKIYCADEQWSAKHGLNPSTGVKPIVKLSSRRPNNKPNVVGQET